MGSPEFAIPTLQALTTKYHVVGVVTQPDRPAGRGKKIVAPPVKEFAQSMAIPILQPERLREPSAVEYVKGWNPHIIVVAAFGQILPPKILDIPTLGCINVHASILPRWRGAAPIRAAILNGDPKTGVTIMKMDPGLDTGPILHTREIVVKPGVTYKELSEKLSELGAEALLEILPKYLSGEITPIPQDDKLATYASMVKKSDAELDFSLPAEKLEKAVRAYNPWPGAYTIIESQRFKILKAHVADEPSPGIGALTQIGDYPAIGTGNGILVLEEVQPAGKKAMKGDVFLRGARSWGK